MDENLKFMLAQRRTKGQFGPYSKELNFPSLITLILDISNKNRLIDFYVVVENFKKSLEQHKQEEFYTEYNAVFNLWQETKSYQDKSIQISYSKELICESNKLLAKLQFRLEKSKKNFLSADCDAWTEKLNITRAIEADCGFYIGALLCFIHSKASLEVASFKTEFVVSNYANTLYKTVEYLYDLIINYNRNEQRLCPNSMLRSLILERHEDIDLFIDALPGMPSADVLRLEYYDDTYIRRQWSENKRHDVQARVVEWNSASNHQKECARIFRNLVVCARSIVDFVVKLKSVDVEWDTDPELVRQLSAFLENTLINPS